jgi:DNA-binding IclR family transcriptional regulator
MEGMLDGTAGAAARGERKSNKATVRVLQVLTKFLERTRPYGVTELANELGISKNMAFRALNTLLEEGYVVRDASGARYELGYGVLALRRGEVEELDLRALCAPYLRRIHELTGESVFLSIIVGRNHVTIDAVEAHGVKVSHNPRGLPVPLHASPASRVLLAFLHDDEIAEYIRVAAPLKRFTPTTIVEPDKLWDEVRLVRGRGYALGYGDHYTGATYVSFAVLDGSGRPHAAITVGGPLDRLTDARVQEVLPRILAIVGELNQRIRHFPASSVVAFG